MQQQDEDLGIGSGERTQEVHDWLDEAIRAAVDAKHGSPGLVPHETADPAEPPLDRNAADAPARPASPRRIGQSTKSDPPFRRSRDPMRVPMPTHDLPDGQSSPLLRYGLIVGAAAIVAYGIAAFSPQPRRVVAAVDTVQIATGATPSETQIAPHLIVHDQQVFTNDPLPFDVTVDRSLANASLRVAGLASGTHLSAGSPVGNSGWTVPLDGLKNLFMYAPTDFVGVMHSAVDLRGPDKKVIDRREVKLEWIEKKKDPSRIGEPNTAANPAPPMDMSKQIDLGDSGGKIDLGKQASATDDPIVTPIVAEDPVVNPVVLPVVTKDPMMSPVVVKDPLMSKETAELLMERGQDLLKSGDIVTARMLFGRLADAGVADAAFAAGQTYDPAYLAAHHVLGVAGDEAKAHEFYQRAAQLGSTDAAAHLAAATAK